MYVDEIKLFNFRKYGTRKEGETLSPGLCLKLNPHLNLLVGENDSGKTAIIDAVKYLLQTHSYDTVRFTVDDFHMPDGCLQDNERTDFARIECTFRGLKPEEAKNFLEWLAIDQSGYSLRVFLVAKRLDRRVTYETRAGIDEGSYFSEGARNLLRVTYLKPLRDADTELAPRKGSRISQILDSHEAFTEKDDHELIKIVVDANTKVEQFFNEGTIGNKSGKQLHDEIDSYLGAFSDKSSPLASRFTIAETRLRGILERLKLSVIEGNRIGLKKDIYPGLGSHNLLFVAAELLLLKKIEYEGLRLALIEEIEAHLHPQAQLRLIEYLQNEAETSDIQLLLSTHSTVLASKVKLDSLFICRGRNVFPMGSQWTRLEEGDYAFLERFLDATRANLFFARGVILVEGDAENLLLPILAELMGYPLSQYGVSIVNVGSTALLRYAKIFQRKDSTTMGTQVAVITDLDVRPDEYGSVDDEAETASQVSLQQKINAKSNRYDGQGVKTFVSPAWTLEYCIALSPNLRHLLLQAINCAKVESNHNVVTEQAMAKAKLEATEELAKAIDDGSSDEDIAFRIYYPRLWSGKVSKAITAQWLARFLLENRISVQPSLISNKQISYLVDAIRYACNSTPPLP